MRYLYFLLLLISFQTLVAQNLNIQWQKTFGGPDGDDIMDIKKTSDGAYIAVGNHGSLGGNITEYYGSNDIWLLKLAINGDIIWQKSYGGTSFDFGTSVQQTADGGYIIGGYSNSTNGDFPNNNGGYDLWVIKTDSMGNVIWKKNMGGTGNETYSEIQQTADGGYIVLCGSTFSTNGDVSGNHGNSDIWLVKLNNLGNTMWQRCYGGSLSDKGKKIQQTPDGGYIIGATSNSTNGDRTSSYGNDDLWVFKTDNLGNIQWQKNYGGNDYDDFSDMKLTSDGGYIIIGSTSSNNGNVSGNHGSSDIWVVKLNNIGDIVWKKCYGGNSNDNGGQIMQTLNGDYIMTGSVWSNNGDITGNHGVTDIWFAKIDGLGNILWKKCFGGSSIEGTRNFLSISNDDFIITGNTYSNNGDVSGNNGGFDSWMLNVNNISSLNTIEPIKYNTPLLYPNPTKSFFHINNLPKGVTIEIIDVLGRKILKEKFWEQKASVNIDQFTNGAYIVQAIYEGEVILSEKLIIQK